MSRYFNGVDQRAYTSLAAPAAFTMACWFRTTDLVNTRVLMSWNQNGSSSHFHFLSTRGAVAGDPISFGSVGGGTIEYASTTAAYGSNVWQHACGVVAANNDRRAYLNGGNKGANTANISPSSLAELNIGVTRSASGLANWFSGLIAMPAVWNVALTEAEIASLAAGFSPDKIRPQNLISYQSFEGDSAGDLIRGAGLWSIFGTNESTDHPPIR